MEKRVLRITKSPTVDLVIDDLDTFGSSRDGADALLAYMFTCVGMGSLNEVLDRLLPFEPGTKDIIAARLQVIMKKAAKELGVDNG